MTQNLYLQPTSLPQISDSGSSTHQISGFRCLIDILNLTCPKEISLILPLQDTYPIFSSSLVMETPFFQLFRAKIRELFLHFSFIAYNQFKSNFFGLNFLNISQMQTLITSSTILLPWIKPPELLQKLSNFSPFLHSCIPRAPKSLLIIAAQSSCLKSKQGRTHGWLS